MIVCLYVMLSGPHCFSDRSEQNSISGFMTFIMYLILFVRIYLEINFLLLLCLLRSL